MLLEQVLHLGGDLEVANWLLLVDGVLDDPD